MTNRDAVDLSAKGMGSVENELEPVLLGDLLKRLDIARDAISVER